jgi:hypothetical protein
MSSDDIIFAPIGMAQEDKEFLWEMIVSALNGTFDDPTMTDLKYQFFNELNDVGRIEIANKQEIREKIHGNR